MAFSCLVRQLPYIWKIVLLKFIYVTGLPPHLGGVTHALGPWQWTNNSTDLLDLKYIIHLLSAVASIKRYRTK